MPEKGYKSLTVPESTYKKLHDFAEKKFTTMPKAIALLLSLYDKNEGLKTSGGRVVG